MLYMGEHLSCWATSVLVALIYAITPYGRLIWPFISISHHFWGFYHYDGDSTATAHTTTVADETPENKSSNAKTNPKIMMKAVLQPLYSNEFNHPFGRIRIAVATLAVGSFAEDLSVYGPVATRHWLHVAFLHTLLIFPTIGLIPKKFTVYPLFRPVARTARLETKWASFQVATLVQPVFLSIMCFQLYFLDSSLKSFTSYKNGIQEIFWIPGAAHPPVWVGQYLAYLFMLCPLMDVSETIVLGFLRFHYPFAVPTAESMRRRCDASMDDLLYDMGQLLALVVGLVLYSGVFFALFGLFQLYFAVFSSSGETTTVSEKFFGNSTLRQENSDC